MATAGLLAAGAQSGYASLVATTGSASSVTSTSAILNGVALTINPSSNWVFEYGTTSSYGQNSRASAVGLGLTAVSTTITNLAPGTTYHYRLVVLQGDPGNASSYSLGDDATFTTPPAPPSYGTTSVASRRLSVKRGLTSISFLCNGGTRSLCKGRVALVARSKSGRVVSCGSSALATSGGHRFAAQSTVNEACMSLLRKARTHTLSGEIQVTLAGAQQPLRSLVTLVGSLVRTKSARRATIAGKR